ncbi:MAG: hypothetical protein DHS80DRAFT_22797 [Piptocephalis tieghemiana]|nr:MAG: hypothetical protein DHS80DRAFT_22797 [Piptocephalis tieghemiana]
MAAVPYLPFLLSLRVWWGGWCVSMKQQLPSHIVHALHTHCTHTAFTLLSERHTSPPLQRIMAARLFTILLLAENHPPPLLFSSHRLIVSIPKAAQGIRLLRQECYLLFPISLTRQKEPEAPLFCIIVSHEHALSTYCLKDSCLNLSLPLLPFFLLMVVPTFSKKPPSTPRPPEPELDELTAYTQKGTDILKQDLEVGLHLPMDGHKQKFLPQILLYRTLVKLLPPPPPPRTCSLALGKSFRAGSPPPKRALAPPRHMTRAFEQQWSQFDQTCDHLTHALQQARSALAANLLHDSTSEERAAQPIQEDPGRGEESTNNTIERHGSQNDEVIQAETSLPTSQTQQTPTPQVDHSILTITEQVVPGPGANPTQSTLPPSSTSGS